MNNKVFVKLIVPEVGQSYDVYLPINKKIGNIINLLNQTINDITSGDFELSNNNYLLNAYTLEIYSPDVLLYNTSIRNGSRLILLN